MRLARTMGALGLGGALLMSAAPADAARERVQGGFVQATPCIPTGGKTTDTPTTFHFECATGSTTWTGDLRGQTILEGVSGTVDVAAGTSHGSAKETVYLFTPDGRIGTLYMSATFTSNGIEFTATNRILRGTGDFAGARGRLRFAGMLFGTGTYTGWLRLKRR